MPAGSAMPQAPRRFGPAKTRVEGSSPTWSRKWSQAVRLPARDLGCPITRFPGSSWRYCRRTVIVPACVSISRRRSATSSPHRRLAKVVSMTRARYRSSCSTMAPPQRPGSIAPVPRTGGRGVVAKVRVFGRAGGGARRGRCGVGVACASGRTTVRRPGRRHRSRRSERLVERQPGSAYVSCAC